jgi:hypothetical protein
MKEKDAFDLAKKLNPPLYPAKPMSYGVQKVKYGNGRVEYRVVDIRKKTVVMERKMKKDKYWMQKAFSGHKAGALHKQLGYSVKQKIPRGLLKTIKNTELGHKVKVKGRFFNRYSFNEESCCTCV